MKRVLLSCLVLFGVFGGRVTLGGPGDLRLGGFADAPKVSVSAAVRDGEVAPGGETVIAVVLSHQAGWHSWPNEAVELPDGFEFAIRTTLDVDDADWLGWVGETQWPATHLSEVASFSGEGTERVPTFDGTAVIYVPIRVGDGVADGVYEFVATLGYQACDASTCLAPEDVRVVAAITVRTGAVAGGASDELFAGFDARGFAQVSGVVTSAGDPDARDGSARTFFGVPVPRGDGVLGYLALAVFGMIGGFILNLTPCVLPVIPIKIMTLSQHARTPGKGLMLGVWMALGVVAFWVAIGIPAAFISAWADPSRLFGIWWVTAGLGALIGVMALGLMGMFAITLPKQVYMVNPEADTPGGSFMFGVMTAVLGLPCFGFIAGALLPIAASLGEWATIITFTAMGVGMAAPYLVLAAKPGWVAKVPRTGPASELVKHVMGWLLLAAAAYFVGSGLIALVSEYPYLGKKLHWWAVALCGVIAGGLLAVKTIQITKRPLRRFVFVIVGVVIGGSGVLAAWSTTAQAAYEYAHKETSWQDYSPGLLADALGEGKTVVMDFTAEWCLNCKALKATVLNREPVRGVLESDDVVMVRADLTSRKAPGWEKLRSLGSTGIPLLVVYGPGLEEPWMSNAYTSQQVLEAVGRARGGDGLAEAR